MNTSYTTNISNRIASKTTALALMSFVFIAQAATPIPELFNDKELTQKSLIGKVFLDTNGDGIQNSNEQGIIGVRLVSVTGVIIETDIDGQFHLQDLSRQSQNILLKLDLSSLPQNAILTTKNPQFMRTSKSGLNKINFGVRF